MKLSTEYDKGKFPYYFIWAIFKYVRFGDEFVLYIISVEKIFSNDPPGLFKFNCQNTFQE